KPGAAGLDGIDLNPRQQLMALRPDVRTINEQVVGELPLKTKRPPFGVCVAKILVEGAALSIQNALRRLVFRQLFRPLRRPAARGSWSKRQAHAVRLGRRQKQ